MVAPIHYKGNGEGWAKARLGITGLTVGDKVG